MAKISRQRVQEWLQDEVTRNWFDGIKEEIKGVQLALGDGQTLGDNAVIDTARAVGRIDGLYLAINISMEAVIEEE